MSDPAELQRRSRYVSLRTFRRSGAPVDTPIWFALSAGRLVMFTNGRSGKVKRLRASSKAAVALCDVRGRLRGGWLDARAEIIADPDREAEGLDALRRRYGWQFRLVELGAKLGGRRRDWVVLQVELTPQTGS